MNRLKSARVLTACVVTLILCACAATPRPSPSPDKTKTQPPMEQETEPASPDRAPDMSQPDPSSPPEPAPEPEPEQESSPQSQPQPEAAVAEAPTEIAPGSTAHTTADAEESRASDGEQAEVPAETPDAPQASGPAEPADSEPARPDLNRQITGRIEVLRNGREQRFSATYLEQTVVAWRPADSSGAAPMEEQQIVTRRNRFYPQTMVVTSGTRVRSPNLDEVQHNVFSITPGHRFDVGVYGPDEGAATVFEGVGTVDIYCNIHPNMAAFLLVLDTAHFTTPDAEGRYRLDNLPPGPGEVLVWNYRADERIVRRELADSNRLGEELELTINITRPSVPQHTTKEGRPYHLPDD